MCRFYFFRTMKLKLEPENKIRRGSLEELNDMYVLGVQRKGFSLLISQKSKNTFYFRQYIQYIYTIYTRNTKQQQFLTGKIIFTAALELTGFVQANSYTRSTILISKELGSCFIVYFVANEYLRDDIEVKKMRCSIN